MARTKINPLIRLKEYVEALQSTFPGTMNFNRKQIDQIGKTNMAGQLAFGSKQGFGHLTKVGFGMYTIPSDWLNGKAPWVGVKEDAPVPSASKTPKTPKATKEPKAPKTKKADVPETLEVAEEKKPTIKVNPKKQLSKKELFEKAKAEIAKKKAAKVAANATATE